VIDHLEDLGAQYDAMCGEEYGVFLGPDAMASAYQRIDDDDVREALDLTGKRVTRAQRIEYFEQVMLEGLLQDADITRAFVPVVLTATDGASVLMEGAVHGYSFSGVETEWEGPFDARMDFVMKLQEDGWVGSVEEFQCMAAERKALLLS
jgi:hypothetical protein